MHTLFELPPEFHNLPYDGSIEYMGDFLTSTECCTLFDELLTSTLWKNDTLFIYGKHITTKRKSAWYGKNPFSYTFSGQTLTAHPWNSPLEKIHQKISERTNLSFNSCLLNLYQDGSQGMGWHADNEPELDPTSPIISISIGAERYFDFKHKTSKFKMRFTLGSGSLLIMHPPTQKFWVHQVPISKKIISPRINLTFRNCQN